MGQEGGGSTPVHLPDGGGSEAQAWLASGTEAFLGMGRALDWGPEYPENSLECGKRHKSLGVLRLN